MHREGGVHLHFTRKNIYRPRPMYAGRGLARLSLYAMSTTTPPAWRGQGYFLRLRAVMAPHTTAQASALVLASMPKSAISDVRGMRAC